MTTENSSLFSLDRLTRAQGPQSRTSVDDDSGLIDLNRLAAPSTHTTKPAYHQAPPPLGGSVDVVEEATLNGVTAVAASQSSNRWLRVSGYVAAIGLMGAVLGLALARLSEGKPEVAAPAAATVIVVAAPAVEPEYVTERNDVADAPDNAEPHSKNPKSEGGRDIGAAREAPPRAHVSSPRPRTPTTKPKQSTEKPKPVAAEPKAPKDPCAHCKGDLACAMRCSVGK